LLDGKDIKTFDLNHLRKSFGVVSQEPTLFNATIESNIKYAKPGASEEEMKAAAKQANALSFIENNDFDIGAQDEKDKETKGRGFQLMVGPKGS